MASPQVLTRPVGPGDLDDLAALFATSRNTRRCWCTAPCGSGLAFGVGWVAGWNRRRFVSVAAGSDAPMGVLASVAASSVGWCACGPRSRYAAATTGASSSEGDSETGGTTWFVPCFYVHPDHRTHGVTTTLLRAAIDVATRHGATAIEGRPAPASTSPTADAFRGGESLFEGLGFQWVAPLDAAPVMRLPLA